MFVTTNYHTHNVAQYLAHRNATTRVYPCCHVFSMASNGSVGGGGGASGRAAAAWWHSQGVAVMPVLGLGTSGIPYMHAAYTRRSAVAEAAAAMVEAQGYDGMMIDFEPAGGNATEYAAVLTAISGAFHARGLKLGACLASWGILGEFGSYVPASLDVYMTMSTYGFTDCAEDHNCTVPPLSSLSPAQLEAYYGHVFGFVQQMLRAGVPADRVDVGLTDFPVGFYGNWTGATVSTFVAHYLEPAGIRMMSLFEEALTGHGWVDVKPFFFETFARFLQGRGG